MSANSNNDRDDDRERPESIDEIREAVDELRKRKSANPDLPDDKLGLWWDEDADVRPDPETDDHWLVTDPDTGRTYSTTVVDLWTRSLEQQDPDEVLGAADGDEDRDRNWEASE